MTYVLPISTRRAKRRWAKENPDIIADCCRTWRLNNPEKARALSKAWKDAHPELVRERSRRWRENNPSYQRERRARLKLRAAWQRFVAVCAGNRGAM